LATSEDTAVRYRGAGVSGEILDEDQKTYYVFCTARRALMKVSVRLVGCSQVDQIGTRDGDCTNLFGTLHRYELEVEPADALTNTITAG
jgi:hypothetical protein